MGWLGGAGRRVGAGAVRGRSNGEGNPPKAFSTDRAMMSAGDKWVASGAKDRAMTAAGERRFLLRDLR